jgi:Ser-tRNA(Ala) deacylase AlaX
MTVEEKFQLQPTLLLYYEDAYIREFTAKALAIQKAAEQYLIVLDQTAFYPLGGGQPFDIGTIKGANGIAVVKDVRVENGLVTHLGDVKGSIAEGEAVVGSIDWNRRYALMRNHTLAHLMAEAIRRATGASSEVVGSGLDVDKARLDIANQSSLGPFLPEIQKAANSVIKENRPVEIKTLQRNEAEEYVARFHENLKTLPPQVQNVRIIEVKGWHACACGGTHVKSTGEIGEAEILRRMSKGRGVERLEFRAKTS